MYANAENTVQNYDVAHILYEKSAKPKEAVASIKSEEIIGKETITPTNKTN